MVEPSCGDSVSPIQLLRLVGVWFDEATSAGGRIYTQKPDQIRAEPRRTDRLPRDRITAKQLGEDSGIAAPHVIEI
jgi:hypothetical protein